MAVMVTVDALVKTQESLPSRWVDFMVENIPEGTRKMVPLVESQAQ